MTPLLTRRDALLFAAASLPVRGASRLRPVRLGGPIFLKATDPKELAREHRRLGYSAAYCPPDLKAGGAMVSQTRDAFAAENVVIAEVGAWVNLLDANPDKRRVNS